MHFIFRLLLLFCTSSIFAQTTIDHIKSTKLNTTRDIKIKLPESYGKIKDKKYPLVLVLDAEYLFYPLEGNISYANYWGDMPEVILVGINQNQDDERYDDTTFDIKNGIPIDKGALFFEFIGTELLPHLESKYKLSSFKAIAGIDATAGFINAFLYKENPLFNAYICLSPDLATGMTDRVPQSLIATKTPIFYYLATSTDGDLKKYEKKCNQLNQNFTSIPPNPLVNYRFDDFKNSTHYSIGAQGIPSALYHIFGVYQPISVKEYQDKIVTLPNDFVKYLSDKYAKIETDLGITMNVRYNDFKAIETAIDTHKAYNELEQLAQIAGQQYDKTMLYDYYMAVYWEKKEDYKKAVNFYQNAFVKQEIGDLTKPYMLNKASDLKKLIPKKLGKKDKTEELPQTPSTEPITEDKK